MGSFSWFAFSQIHRCDSSGRQLDLRVKNQRETIEIINTRMGRSLEQAEEDYHRFLCPSAGLTDRCAFDPHSLSTVLEMRRRLGMIQSPLPSLDKYYDDSFYREAVSLIR